MSNIRHFLQAFPEVCEPKSSLRFLYLSALHAERIEDVTNVVLETENAMFARSQELSGQPGDIQERAQLNEASTALLKIKIGKLGWPNPFSDFEKGTNGNS